MYIFFRYIYYKRVQSRINKIHFNKIHCELTKISPTPFISCAQKAKLWRLG